MGDTNRVALRIVPEIVPGTTPVTPAFQALRITGTPSLAFTPQTVTTDEIRPDRQITDLILVGAEAGGDAGFELSASALDTILEGAMSTVWIRRNNRIGSQVTSIASNIVTVATGTTFNIGDLILFNGFSDANDDVIIAAILTTNATTITAGSGLTDNASPPVTAQVRNIGVATAVGDIVAATGPNRLTSTILNFTTLGLTVGEWVNIGGTATANQFATTANNDWVRISAISATALTFDVVPSGWVTDTGVGKTVWLFFGDSLINGSTLTQYTLEREFSDISVFEYFEGMAINTLAFQLSAQSLVTATAGFLGFDANVNSSRFSGATTVVAPSESVVNTSSNVGRIGRGGSPIVGPNFVLEATIEINNNLRRQNAVASLGAIGVGIGEFAVTGTLNTYFGNTILLNDVLNNTETSLDFRFDGATNITTTKRTVLFDLPRVKYSSGAPAVPGKNQDVLLNLGYQALRHATLGYTMRVQQFHGTQV